MSTISPTINLVGYFAAACTTVSLVPQLARVWRLRSARDISLVMFSVYSLGVILWLVYGLCLHFAPIILANAISIVLSVAILVLKLRFDRK